MSELTTHEMAHQQPGERPASRTSVALRTHATLLTYHEILDSPSSDQYSVSDAQFDRHLELTWRLARQAKIPADCIAISFDDGHASNFSLALPLLGRHRLKAVFFITAGWVGSKPGYMNWEQAKALHRAGHVVQSHGWSHKFLSKSSDSELQFELTESKRVIEDRLNAPVSAISIPGGRWDDRVLKACAAAGYNSVYTSDPLFTTASKYGIQIHGRMMVRRSMNLNELEKFLTADSFYLFNLRLRYRSTLALRMLMSDASYHRLWRWVAARHTEPTEAIRIP